jgi:hypothetical protein
MITSSLLAASLLALGFGEASAADRKIKAGAECVQWKGATPVLSYGALHNPSSHMGTKVDCPITRDVKANGGIRRAQVRVLDKHGSDSVSCQLFAAYRDRSGNMIERGSPPQSSEKTIFVQPIGSPRPPSNVNGPWTLSFNPSTRSVRDGEICTYTPFYPFGKRCTPKYKTVETPAAPYQDYSHAYLTCRIPPAYHGQSSAIDSYLVEEND